MPRSTVIFGTATSQVSFSEFSIVGQFSQDKADFVRHVAILDGEGLLPGTVRVYHMGPPLVSHSDLPDIPDHKKELSPDLAVTLELDERAMYFIADWAARIAEEEGPSGFDRYVILPAVEPSQELSENGQPKYHRFSCAGYVVEALKKGGVELCDFSNLPLADLQFLVPAYPDLPRIMAKPKIRKQFGVESNPPWPVLLPGYLFHGADQYLHDRTAVKPTIAMAHYPKFE